MSHNHSPIASVSKNDGWARLAAALTRMVAPQNREPRVAIELICLANSRKHGGRCLAGLKTDGSGWVRPIGPGPDGALQPQHYRLGSREAQALDKLSVGLSRPAPKPHQPENWLLERKWYNPWHKPCRRVGPAAASEIRPLLEAQLARGPELLGCRRDRVDFGTFAQMPAQASLALVRPENLRWLIKTGGSGKRQTRAVFDLAGAAYNLSVTDPIWEQRLSSLAFGTHPYQSADPEAEDVLLTVSLGEPFGDCCYKLVAAVIVLPPLMPEEANEETNKAQ